MSYSDIIQKFVEGRSKDLGTGNVFIRNDTLFSYGTHFPLLLRMPHWNGFLLNADKYSSSTSKHQRWCFKYATVQIPFSALIPALQDKFHVHYSSDLKELNLIDKAKEKWELVSYYRKDATTNLKVKHISIADFNKLGEEKQYYQKHEERRPEACVIEYKGRYFLSSMDEDQYFISELPEPCKTVEEAFDSLKPREIFNNNIKGYHRQGEWFFVDLQIPKKEAKKSYECLEKDFILPRPVDSGGNPLGNKHIATRGGFAMDISFNEIPKIPINDKTLITTGQIKHRQHKILRLSTSKDIKLFAAFRGRDVQSWSASGRVD